MSISSPTSPPANKPLLTEAEKKEKLDNFITLFKSHNYFDINQGFQLQVNDLGEWNYSFTVENKHLSSPGICHGGVLSGLMDASLGLEALMAGIFEDKICSTVEFKINYLGPARLGDTLIGRGKVEFKGSRLIVTSADIIHSTDGRLIAKGLGTFNLYPFSKKAGLYGQSSS